VPVRIAQNRAVIRNPSQNTKSSTRARGAPPQRAPPADRPAPAAADRCRLRRFLFREWIPRGERWSRRWCAAPTDPGAQACSLSVDVVQRQRHAAPTTAGWSGRRGRGGFLFGELRSAPAAMALKDGPRAAGASGRGGDLRGRGAIAGLLRTAVGCGRLLLDLRFSGVEPNADRRVVVYPWRYLNG
jgi:hypothetical protein